MLPSVEWCRTAIRPLQFPCPLHLQASVSILTHQVWKVAKKQTINVNLGEMGCRPLQRANYCGKDDDIRSPCSQRRALWKHWTLTRLPTQGRGRGTKQHVPLGVGSLKYRFMNSIKPHFFLFIGPVAFTHWGKELEKKTLLDKLLTAWAFGSP